MEPDPPARVPARLVLASIAGVWLCYFLLASLRGAVAGFEFSLPMLSRRLVVTLAAMALTALLVWPVLRALDARALWLRALAVLLVALPASVGIAAINQWAFADIESEVIARIGEKEGIKIRKDEAGNVLVDVPGDQELAEANAVLLDTNRWRQISDLALGRYFVLLAWAALYLAFANAEQARAAERREGEYRRAAKAAELRSLRYQVNPHFLFNTLNSLSALVLTGKGERAERMIQTLSTFYRRSLSEDPTADHTLAEEIELQRLYLDIEAVRFPERLRVRIDIPDDLPHARVPGMILQPLVENSVKYAVAARRDPVTIAIAARAAEGWLEIAVSDDGPGAVHPPAEGCGIGLANVRDRLAARFGAEAGLESGPAPGGWRTTIRLPLEVVA
ncbi:MAG TPA: histidine kinase [Novosphingobium sp.]|nr:histidine kinase [Novosphingobium sp.]